MNTQENQNKRNDVIMKISKKRIVIVLLILAVGAAGIVYYLTQNTTYKNIQVAGTYEAIGMDNGNYIQYADGVLKYSKDGIAFLTQQGEQLWNQSCQMANPIVERCGGMSDESVVVADQGGTSILVFQKDGLKGEINATRPIEKVAVSEQGIVAAVLQDADTPMVMCYDAKGNVLVKHTASLENTGYPLDIAISPDGNVLLVSYLCIEGTTLHTKTAYYHFGEAGEDKTNHLVAETDYQDTIIPTTAFLGGEKSLLISEEAFILYDGLEKPEEKRVVELGKEIKSVAYDREHIVFVLKNEDSNLYELRIYNTSGTMLGTTEFEGEYTNLKVTGKQIVLFSANICAIFNEKGFCKYQGTLENSIINLFPITGINKYMMISADGFEEVQLAK